MTKMICIDLSGRPAGAPNAYSPAVRGLEDSPPAIVEPALPGLTDRLGGDPGTLPGASGQLPAGPAAQGPGAGVPPGRRIARTHDPRPATGEGSAAEGAGKGMKNGWEHKKLGDGCLKLTDGTHSTPTDRKEGVPFLLTRSPRWIRRSPRYWQRSERSCKGGSGYA